MINGDDPYRDENSSTLDRIARTLGVPVAAFLTAAPADTPVSETAVVGPDHPAEVVTLLRLFVRLKSPESRARCLAYVVYEATHDG